MLRTISAISIALSLTVMAVPTSDAGSNVGAGNQSIKRPHQARVFRQSEPVRRRTCDWVGPGGRAVYRCGPTEPLDVTGPLQRLAISQNDPAPQRTCDWVGPGGRAVYRCR